MEQRHPHGALRAALTTVAHPLHTVSTAAALSAAGASIQVVSYLQGAAPVSSSGDFVARPVPSRIVLLPELLNAIEMEPESLFIVDARDIPEFDGIPVFGSGTRSSPLSLP